MVKGEYSFVFFKECMECEWDEFVMHQSINGTFLQTWKFLNYHPQERFEDASVLVYINGELIAVCPACCVTIEQKKTYFSHKGSTFGGIVLAEKIYNSHNLINLIVELEKFICLHGYQAIYLKPTSNLFTSINNDLMEYCLYYNNYDEYKELSTYFDLKCKMDIIDYLERRKRTYVRKCEKSELLFKKLDRDKDIQQFYTILCENLSIHNATPVHSLDELLELKNIRLKEEVGFYGIFLQEEIIAGAMVFYFKKTLVAHTQYLALNRLSDRFHSMTYLLYCLMEEMKKCGYEKISWGISTENKGRVLNLGLIEFKESFGSKYLNNKIFHKSLE